MSSRTGKLIWAQPPPPPLDGAQTSQQRKVSSSASSLFVLVGAVIVMMTSLLLSDGVICGRRAFAGPAQALKAARHQSALSDRENMPLNESAHKNEDENESENNYHHYRHQPQYHAHTGSDGGRHRRHYHHNHNHHHHHHHHHHHRRHQRQRRPNERAPQEGPARMVSLYNHLGSVEDSQQSLDGHRRHNHLQHHCGHDHHNKNKHSNHQHRKRERGLLREQFRVPPARLNKRQALNEAIHELRILESQDGQLRAFADESQPLTQQQQRQADADVERAGQRATGSAPISGPHPGKDFHCHLKLMTNGRPKAAQQAALNQAVSTSNNEHAGRLERREQELELAREHGREERTNVCLREGQLAIQIPPFMMNLYRQLAAETLHLNFSETVQMMPYKAEVMRSFRQPKLAKMERQFGAGWWLADGDGAARLDEASAGRMRHLQANHNYSKRNLWKDRQDYGERAALSESGQTSRDDGNSNNNDDDDDDDDDDNDDQKWEKIGNVVVELGVFNGSDDKLGLPDGRAGAHASPAPNSTYRAGQEAGPTQSPACDPKQRLLPAGQRDEICFWFKLDAGLPNLISGAADDGRRPWSWPGLAGARERLVEAELHVFKLFPQQQQQQPSSDSVQRDNPRLPASGQTNRLPASPKVSLYQILPRKLERGEFPLRLLDIRRIDLNANGWETFYVKRAVEDWLREPRSNLGLVIRAKSMFDEPIPVGLIRFADAYDSAGASQFDASELQSGAPRASQAAGPNQRAGYNFDLVHQPLLVIYTTRQATTT